jgi:hypothetical protein
VSKATRLPTGYQAHEMHPDLLPSLKARPLIETPAALEEWLKTHP